MLHTTSTNNNTSLTANDNLTNLTQYVLFQQNTAASLLELYFNDSMQTVYACGGGVGSQQREVADGPM